MYAYELAPPSVIPPLSIEEERAMTLPQIQRLQHSSESPSGGIVAQCGTPSGGLNGSCGLICLW